MFKKLKNSQKNISNTFFKPYSPSQHKAKFVLFMNASVKKERADLPLLKTEDKDECTCSSPERFLWIEPN